MVIVMIVATNGGVVINEYLFFNKRISEYREFWRQ